MVCNRAPKFICDPNGYSFVLINFPLSFYLQRAGFGRGRGGGGFGTPPQQWTAIQNHCQWPKCKLCCNKNLIYWCQCLCSCSLFSDKHVDEMLKCWCLFEKPHTMMLKSALVKCCACFWFAWWRSWLIIIIIIYFEGVGSTGHEIHGTSTSSQDLQMSMMSMMKKLSLCDPLSFGTLFF